MRFFKLLSAAVYPNRCCGCGAVIFPDEMLCEKCEKSRARFSYDKGFCKVCGQMRRNCICEKRQFFSKSVFAFFYTDSVKSTVHKFKFRGKLFYGRLFARQMYRAAVESGITDDAEYVVPIPMHPVKKFRRGFNQTEILAKEFSKISGIPVLNALDKLILSPSQHDLDPLARAGNVAGTFEVKDKFIETVDGAKIIIIDDIMTTHATLNEAAKTLLVFGAEKTDVLTAAAAFEWTRIERDDSKDG